MVIAALICNHIECQYPAITLKELDRVLAKEIYPHYKRRCHQKRSHASACSHRFNATRFSKTEWASYPELGSVYKAAVVKSMLFWCHDYLKEHVGRTAGAEMRYHCIYGFAKFQFLLDINGPFLGLDDKRQTVKYGRAGLLFYQQLAALDRARTDGKRFYKVTPKFHSLFEMLLYIEETSRHVRCLISKFSNFIHQIL